MGASTHSNADVIRDLTRAKVTFQARTVAAIVTAVPAITRAHAERQVTIGGVHWCRDCEEWTLLASCPICDAVFLAADDEDDDTLDPFAHPVESQFRAAPFHGWPL